VSVLMADTMAGMIA